MNSENTGSMRISEDVIISIAESAVNNIKGVEKIRSGYGFLRKLFVNDRPVNVRVSGDVTEISIDVVLKYGCNAAKTSEKIQEAVKNEIQAMTGITVSRVNVTISGISFDK